MLNFNTSPSLNMSLVGFGQGGCRIVDVFASFKTTDDRPFYRTFALNSNRNDLMGLKYIPQTNRISLDLGGFGKDPTEAIDILGSHEESNKKIQKLLESLQEKDDDLFVFCATLGGGTGTSTIVKTLDMYIEKYVKPTINLALLQLLKSRGISLEQFKLLDKKTQLKTRIKAAEQAFRQNKIRKIGIIATLPVRGDGVNPLRQVNKFTDYIWKLANNPLNGIAFVTFPDNQKFYDDYLENRDLISESNYRDYANARIAEVFHELNLATNMSGTDVTFDPRDFRKVLLDGEGYLNINRIAVDSKNISSSDDMYNLLSESFKGSLFHSPIQLQELDEDNNQLVHQKVHNVGLLSVTNDQLTDISSSYLDDVKQTLSTNLYLDGSIFTGHVHLERTSFKAYAYTFYKTLGLPERLRIGLVEELEEYQKRKHKVKFKVDSIEKVSFDDQDDLDLSDFEQPSLHKSLGSDSDIDFLSIDNEEKDDKKEEEITEEDLAFLRELDNF